MNRDQYLKLLQQWFPMSYIHFVEPRLANTSPYFGYVVGRTPFNAMGVDLTHIHANTLLTQKMVLQPGYTRTTYSNFGAFNMKDKDPTDEYFIGTMRECMFSDPNHEVVRPWSNKISEYTFSKERFRGKL